MIVQQPGGTIDYAHTDEVEVCHLVFEEDGPASALPAGAEWEHLASELGVLEEVQPALSEIGCIVITSAGNSIRRVVVRCNEAELEDENYYSAAEEYVEFGYQEPVSLVVSVNDRLYTLLGQAVTHDEGMIKAGDWV